MNPDRTRKSSGSETTFATDRTDPDGIEAGVLEMADDVWAWCQKTDILGRTVTVKVKWGDFRQSTRSRSFAAPVASHEALRRVSLDLVRTLFPPPQGVRLVGVTVSNLGPADQAGPAQLALVE